MERCKAWGLTTRADNPAKGIRRFRERSRDRVLDDEEARLFAALPVSLLTVTRLALEAGAAACSLAEYAKKGNSRVLPLGDAMTATLRTLKATATRDPVFPTALGGHLHHFPEHCNSSAAGRA
jgi:hypothetical protein